MFENTFEYAVMHKQRMMESVLSDELDDLLTANQPYYRC